MKTRVRNWLFAVTVVLFAAQKAQSYPGQLTGEQLQAVLDEANELWYFGTNSYDNCGGLGEVAALAGLPPPRRIGSVRPQSTDGDSGVSTLFGTATLGGSKGQGTVFSLDTNGADRVVLYNFTGGFDGGFPAGGVVVSGDTLFGTTLNGGSAGNGAVYSIGTNGTGYTVLHNFSRRGFGYTNSDGSNPYGGLLVSGDTLYGATTDGGTGNSGTVYALKTNGTGFAVLHYFTPTLDDTNYALTNSDGAVPYDSLILAGDTLYGTTEGGGKGGTGTVFSVNTNGADFTVLHAFAAEDPLRLTNSDGIGPFASLILSGDMLYGTTSQGGIDNSGTVFAVNTNGTLFTNLYVFTGGADGNRPVAPLVLFSNALVGTCVAGGNSGGEGTIYALNTNGMDFGVVYSFSDVSYDTNYLGTNSDGANPQAGLLVVGDTMYGAAAAGGTAGTGAIFKLAVAPPSEPIVLGVRASGSDLRLNCGNGHSGKTYKTLSSSDLTLPLNQWTPVETNVLSVSGNFTVTVANAVDAKATQRFYIVRSQ